MRNFIANQNLVRVAGASAAGQTTINTDTVDTKSIDGVTFLLSVASMADTAVITATVQGGDASDGSDAIDLELSATHTADGTVTGKLIGVEAFRPLHRYLRLKIERSTANTAVDSVVAVLSQPKEAPVTQGDTVLATAFSLSPEAAA